MRRSPFAPTGSPVSRGLPLLALVLAMLALAVPGHAAAAGPECGTGSSPPYFEAFPEQTFPELRAAVEGVSPGQGELFYLTESITASPGESLAPTPGATVALDLNGCDLTIAEPGEGAAAIAVPPTAELRIEDSSTNVVAEQGSLEAWGGDGVIEEEGGISGGGGGAGIGGTGGRSGIMGGDAGAVSISGGNVSVVGGINGNFAGTGAGIGGGGGGELAAGGDAGAVSISGGSVTTAGGTGASTGGDGAGIGGGGGGEEGRGGAAATVSISGGTLAAVGGVGSGYGSGAGIGGGGGGELHEGVGGAGGMVSVTGGSVSATGGAGGIDGGGGAGVGGGGGGFTTAGGAGGAVSVSGGTLTATGGAGGSRTEGPGGEVDGGGAAGIGGGGGGDGFFTEGGAGGTVSITGGTVAATGGPNGVEGRSPGDFGTAAGIGGGDRGGASYNGPPGGPASPGGPVVVEQGMGPSPSLTGDVAAVLTVKPGAFLAVPAAGTLTLDASDRNEGTITVAGTLTGTGALENPGVIAVSGQAWSVAGYDGPGDEPSAPTITGHAYGLSFAVPSGTAPGEIWAFAPTVAEGGESLPQPTPPAGGTFEGWFTEAVGGTQVTDSSVLGGDRMLFAHYTNVTQAITFPSPVDHTLGDPDIEPGATASSGLKVTYGSQTPTVCTIVAGKVHLVSAGECTVTAEQDGNAEYAPAPSVARSFAIAGEPGETVVTTQPVTPPTTPVPSSSGSPEAAIVLLHTPNTPHRPDTRGGPRWTFVFTDAAPGMTYRCRIDGRSWRGCSSPTVYRGLARGPHVFRLRAVDPAGQGSPVEAVRFRVGRRG